MHADLRQVVEQLTELTGAPAPQLLSSEAAAPDAHDLAQRAEEGFYLIGLIGGKEVGKSALINALVGQSITRSTSWGEGTQHVIAYAHHDHESSLRALLDREVAGRFEIVTHSIDDLRACVLLDLPDIDSHWKEHVQVTRRMLRHMLYPVWMQSVEKYADVRAQALLREVSAGNAPDNFVFVLNKVDQVGGRHAGPEARSREVTELCADYAQRLRGVLKLEAAPRIYAISAVQPDGHDLPELRRALLRARSKQAVERSIELADRRQAASVLQWVRDRQLPVLVARTDRLVEQAEELIAGRLAPLLLDQATAPLTEDPARRLELVDASLAQRVRAWPLVNIVHGTLWPVLALIRANVGRSAAHEAGLAAAAEPVVQGIFGQLYQTQPVIGSLYARRRLWEPMAAQQAVGRLQEGLGRTGETHRRAIIQRAGRSWAVLAPLRWLLTLGALIWFPIAQPLLATLLPQGAWPGVYSVVVLLISVISVSFLLQNAVFLLLWYALLWIVLRWSTQRRVDRLLTARHDTESASDPAGIIADWTDELLAPLHAYQQRLHDLQQHVQQIETRAA